MRLRHDFFAVYYGLEFVRLEVCVFMTLADIFARSYDIDSVLPLLSNERTRMQPARGLGGFQWRARCMVVGKFGK